MSDKPLKTNVQKKSKIEELKKKGINEMSLDEARVYLQLYKIQVQTGEEKDTSKLRKLKRRIARLLTEKNKGL